MGLTFQRGLSNLPEMVGSQVGAYRVLAQIGEGATGSVWLAEHTLLGRRAAIKLLHPELSRQPEMLTRFFRSRWPRALLSDPGIVQIFDFGEHTDGRLYIAMEMLEGEPLNRRLERLGRLPLGEALRILRQIASTLGVAHAHSIVHRDLMPENIFLVPDPDVIGGERAKVLDFRIALDTDDASDMTHEPAVLRTLAYMSPEQWRGGFLDSHTDVYALGCILFVLLTGRPPFEAEAAAEMCVMHLHAAPPPPSRRAAGIPPEIDALVLRCLAKDPEHRFSSGTELAAEIGRFLDRPRELPVARALAPRSRRCTWIAALSLLIDRFRSG